MIDDERNDLSERLPEGGPIRSIDEVMALRHRARRWCRRRWFSLPRLHKWMRHPTMRNYLWCRRCGDIYHPGVRTWRP